MAKVRFKNSFSPGETRRYSAMCLCLLVLCTILPDQTLCRCPDGPPQAGKCGSGVDPKFPDDYVGPVSKGACLFSTNSLCSYRQGCKDPGMADWVVDGGSAVSRQRSTPCTSLAFSVLESRWLNFTSEHCVQFSFKRLNPADLDVFFDVRGGSMVTVVNRTITAHAYDRLYCVQFTVGRLIGKILFRAYGGGVGGSVKLKEVGITPGTCDGQGAILTVTGPPTITAKQTSPTTTTTTTTETTISKSSTQTSEQPTTPNSIRTAVTSQNYGQPSSSFSSVSTLADTTTDGHWTSQGLNLRHSTSVGVDHSDQGTGDSDKNIGLIAGAAAAAVAVIVAIVIIVVIVVRRKRNEDKSYASHDSKEMTTHTKGDSSTQNDYSAVDDTKPSPDGDYYEAGGCRLRYSDPVQESEIDPYDLSLEDEAPKSKDTRDLQNSQDTHDVDVDLYNRINHSNQKPSALKNEDDYNHISHIPKPAPCDSLDQTYAQVQKKGKDKTDAGNDYAVVNKKAKKPNLAAESGPIEDEFNTINHHARPRPSEGDYNTIDHHTKSRAPVTEDSYDRVRGGNGTEAVTSSEKHLSRGEMADTEDDYNTIDHHAKSRNPVAEDTCDPYDRVGAGHADDGVTPAMEQFSQGVIGDTGGDYNTLDFDNTSRSLAVTGTRETTRQAYDHVTRDPDDTYNRARLGKLSVVSVVDSDYDHVQH